MRPVLLLVPSLFFAAACGSAPAGPKPAATPSSSSSSAEASEPRPATEKSAAERWAEAKTANEAAGTKREREKDALDPLSLGGSLEASTIPKMELTPAKELRAKSRSDLNASLALLENASTLDEATAKLVARLGKPTWVEDGKKRIWVVKDGKQCHRLVLEADGTVEVETASASEWRMLSAVARQNPCTGEIERGVR
jgi:ferric-dicitrate binding protein FerR (iron transport regulator)